LNRSMNPWKPAGIAVLLVPVLAGSMASPQQPARPQEPIYRVQSNLVIVDVTVRDKKGNPLSNLKKEDFAVYEDNVRQEIVTFSLEQVPVTAPETLAAESASVPKVPPVNFGTTPRNEMPKDVLRDHRLMILFFDLSSLSTDDLIRSVTTAQDFVSKQAGPHDLVAIATYSSTLQVIQDLTNDRDLLRETLKHLNPTEAGDTPGEDLGDVATSDDMYVPDDVQFNIFNTDRRLSALETLAKSYREFQERKSLIYFSSGVTTTGTENQSQIRSTVDVANQSNMSIYTVDSRGLMALPPGGDASRGSPGGRALFTGDAVSRQMSNLAGSRETLTTLAHDTGGTAFEDNNDLAPVFDRVLRDTQAYYILGYYSSNTRQDGKFRKVRVEVQPPDLKLQHRPGYFASKSFTQLTQGERERQLEEAFNVDRPFTEIPFILQADYFKGEAGNCIVPVSLLFAGDGVDFEQKGNNREAQLEFLARVSGTEGKVAGVARDLVNVRLPAVSAEKVRSGQVYYTTGFQLRPGSYTLKFLVRDNRSGKLGTFEQPVEVPALDIRELQTSSIILGSRLVQESQDSRGVEHRGVGARFPFLERRRDPLEIAGQRIVPSISNVFLRNQTLYLYLQVYGAGEDPQTRSPKLTAQMLFLKDKSRVMESQPRTFTQWAPEGKGTASVTMSMPLRALAAGKYTLQIHISDETTDTNVFRRVALVIR